MTPTDPRQATSVPCSYIYHNGNQANWEPEVCLQLGNLTVTGS